MRSLLYCSLCSCENLCAASLPLLAIASIQRSTSIPTAYQLPRLRPRSSTDRKYSDRLTSTLRKPIKEFFGFLPLRTFCFMNGSPVTTKSCGKVIFAYIPIFVQFLEIIQWLGQLQVWRRWSNVSLLYPVCHLHPPKVQDCAWHMGVLQL